jgi:hypothetical protein
MMTATAAAITAMAKTTSKIAKTAILATVTATPTAAAMNNYNNSCDGKDSRGNIRNGNNINADNYSSNYG